MSPLRTDPRDTGRVDDASIGSARDGLDFDRLPVFCDAILAIAITLVAVEIGVPENDSTSARELWAAVARDVPTIIAFFITFAILASYRPPTTALWLPRGIHGRLPHVDDGVPRDTAFLPHPAATFGQYPDNPVAVSLLAVAASAVSTMEAALFWSAFRGDPCSAALGA